MTDFVLALVPQYGLWLIFGVVLLACLAFPLPASMLVLASGSFAASGDLIVWQVFVVTFAAFVIGDQIAYRIAHKAGAPLLDWMGQRPRVAPLVQKSKDLLGRRGTVAVLLSHTVLSPTCPYVSYLCGAGGMTWRAFTATAVFGAGIWSAAYVGLGFVFATQLSQVAEILSDFLGIVMAGAVGMACFMLLRSRWRQASAAPSQV